MTEFDEYKDRQAAVDFYRSSGVAWVEVGRRLGLTEEQAFRFAYAQDRDTAIEEWIRAASITGIANTNGFESRADTSLSWDDETRTLTLAPTGDSFAVWVRGTRVVVTEPLTAQVGATSGLYVIVFDKPEAELTVIETPAITGDIIRKQALVGVVYWNAVTSSAALVGDERHGLMPSETHAHFHEALGSQIRRDYRVGGVLQSFALTGMQVEGTGADVGSASISIQGGALRDEDLELPSSDTSQELGTPAASTPLDAAPITPAEIPTLYRLGAEGVWFLQSGAAGYVPLNLAIDVPLLSGNYAGTRQPANVDNAGTWELSELGANDFVLVHLFATNDIRHRVVAVQGQKSYATANDAEAGAKIEIRSIELDGLVFPELAPLHTLVVQTASYTNDANARFADAANNGSAFVDWRFG